MNNRHKERYFSNKYCLWFVKNIEKAIRKRFYQMNNLWVLAFVQAIL